MLKVGVIGAGSMGKRHSDVYAKNPDTELIGIADIRLEEARKVAKMYNMSAYSDADILLNSEEVDIIDICLPTFLHCQYVLKAAEGRKHVICEKPIAMSLEEADRMIEATERARVKFMVAHVIRFWPAYLIAKELVSGGGIGRPLIFTSQRLSGKFTGSWDNWFTDPRRSGGALLDLHIHDLDYIIWLFGRPESVVCYGIRSDTGAWDHVLTTLGFENGVRAFAEASCAFPTSYPFITNFRILGERGCLEFNGERLIKYTDTKFEEIKLPAQDPYFKELEYFIECVKEDREPMVITPVEAKKILEVDVAALKSLESGDIVRL